MKKRLFKDRKDAIRYENISSLNQILIDLKPKRSLSEVYINQEFEVTELVKFYENLKKETKEITYFHLFVTLIGRIMYIRPKLNMFVSNRHLYVHNDVTVSFVAKKEFNDNSEEIMQIIKINESDNLKTISEKILNKLDNTRKYNENLRGANNAINYISKLPNVMRIPFIGIAKFLDNVGLIPNLLIKDNIYYSSTIVSNLGSINCDSIYHNLTDFGTCSSLITIGKIEERKIMGKIKYFCSFGITIDERIADGYYLVKTVEEIRKILDNPEILTTEMNRR